MPHFQPILPGTVDAVHNSGMRQRALSVLVVDDDRDGLRRGFGVVPGEVDKGPNFLDQLVERDGFVHVLFGARPKLSVLLERLFARLARQNDERNLAEDRILLQLVADREPVHPGQLDSEQNEVGFRFRRLRETRVSVFDDSNVATEPLEAHAKITREGGVALEHENV